MSQERWEYNAKDCCATRLVADALLPKVYADPMVQRVYEAEMRLQAAFLAVQMRGIRVDEAAAAELAEEMRSKIGTCIERAEEVAGHPLTGPKAFSTDQLKAFFYDELEMRRQQNKERRLSTDENVLKRFIDRRVVCDADVPNPAKGERKDKAAVVAKQVMKARELGKLLAVLECRRYGDRIRGSINVGATETFRASSSKTPLGDGTNLQNQTKELRRMFIPDEGYTMIQGDQERAESMAVAYVSGDEGYIRAHQEGNTHLTVARLVWPEANWTGDFAHDLALCKEPNFIKHHSRYDLSKRIQHGSNYKGSARGIAIETKLPIKVVEEAQERYFEQFPGIPKWHECVREQLIEEGCIEVGGYRRQFFGNPKDKNEGTLREAIAHIPQSLVAWTNHIAFYRLWSALDSEEFQVLMHTHDGFLAQFIPPFEEWEQEINELCLVEWKINGRSMIIPWEFNIGTNWKEVS